MNETNKPNDPFKEKYTILSYTLRVCDSGFGQVRCNLNSEQFNNNSLK